MTSPIEGNYTDPLLKSFY